MNLQLLWQKKLPLQEPRQKKNYTPWSPTTRSSCAGWSGARQGMPFSLDGAETGVDAISCKESEERVNKQSVAKSKSAYFLMMQTA
jgi:hypothetical protein